VELNIEEDTGERLPCNQCGRKFNAAALAKHSKICAKVFVQKRKTFNMAAQRVEGEAKQAMKADAGNTKLRGGKPIPKWKQESQALRANLGAARITDTNSAEYEKAAAAASSINASALTGCDHCGRKFNDEAAARHIPICAQKAKDSRFKKGPMRR
jgi:hypothetical protein